MTSAELSEFFSRHKKVCLQFSSGKDSAACLQLCEPWLGKLDVVWGCQGNPYPETLEYMQAIARRVPRFHIVEGMQPTWVKAYGRPVDVLPFRNTKTGVYLTPGEVNSLFQLPSDCCGANLWKPMTDFVSRTGYTGVIRGQKKADVMRSRVYSGTVAAGVEYIFPLNNWTDEQVFEFLGPNIPASYTRGLKSSLDCMDCSAFAEENFGKVDDLDYINPAAAASVRATHSELRSALNSQLKWLEL